MSTRLQKVAVRSIWTSLSSSLRIWRDYIWCGAKRLVRIQRTAQHWSVSLSLSIYIYIYMDILRDFCMSTRLQKVAVTSIWTCISSFLRIWKDYIWHCVIYVRILYIYYHSKCFQSQSDFWNKIWVSNYWRHVIAKSSLRDGVVSHVMFAKEVWSTNSWGLDCHYFPIISNYWNR